MAGKLRPSPSASATAFAPGTVKKGNDGNKYVIVVASNGVPRWQKAKPGLATKMAMKKPGMVKKLGMKKPTLAMKVKLPYAYACMPRSSAYAMKEQLALDVCRRLNEGQLRISDLGKSPDTKGYVLLRDFAKKYMSNKANYNKFQKTYCGPAGEEDSDGELLRHEAMDPVLTTIAYLPAQISDTERYNGMRILFSDDKDKKFFSLGVTFTYIQYSGDSANQFYYDFLVKKKYKPSQIGAQLKGKDYKIMEDLMVKQYKMH